MNKLIKYISIANVGALLSFSLLSCEENNTENKADTIEYIIGGGSTDNSISVTTNSDTYGVQEDLVYILPVGNYTVEMLVERSTGSAGLVEIENQEVSSITEDGYYYEYFQARETISFNKLTNELGIHEITINENEQVDVNGNIVVKLTKQE